MRFLEKNKILVGVIVAILFCFVAFISFQFFREEEEKPDISKDPVVLPDENEWEIVNQSSLSIEELWDLVNTKKSELRKLFYESQVYHISEIDSENYTEADDDVYVVFDSKFVEQLNQLLTEELYHTFLNQMRLVKDSYYVSLQEDFSYIYFESAIAETRVDSSEIRLMSASDEYINASVLLNICESEEDTECKLLLQKPFELRKVGESWKVNKF